MRVIEDAGARALPRDGVTWGARLFAAVIILGALAAIALMIAFGLAAR